MQDMRTTPPATLAGDKVSMVKDYSTLEANNVAEGKIEKLDFPETSNVLQFFTENGYKVSVRPSGTRNNFV